MIERGSLREQVEAANASPIPGLHEWVSIPLDEARAILEHIDAAGDLPARQWRPVGVRPGSDTLVCGVIYRDRSSAQQAVGRRLTAEGFERAWLQTRRATEWEDVE